MAQPLPEPFVDTGLTCSYQLSASLELMLKPTRLMELSWARLSMLSNGDLLGRLVRPFAYPWNPFAFGQVVVGPTVLETAPWAPTPPGPGVAGPMSSSQSYQEEGGPFRLGMSIGEDLASLGNTEGRRVTYGLFTDETTLIDVSLGSLSWSEDFSTQDFPFSLPFTFHLKAFAQEDITNAVEMRWTGVTLGTAIDFSALQEGPNGMAGTSGGQVTITKTASGQVGSEHSFGMPITFSVDLDAQQWDGTSLAADIEVVIRTPSTEMLPEPLLVTTPYQDTLTYHFNSWQETLPDSTVLGKEVSARITPAGLAALGLPDDSDPLLALQASPPRLDPRAFQTYAPLTLRVESPVSCFPSTNTWAAENAETAVSGTGNKTWTVDPGGGGAVSRDLKSKWRDWVGLGAGGKSHADFGVDRYTITKHDYLTDAPNLGQDVWSWASYGWAELVIDVPDDCALTLVVEGVQVHVTDSHAQDAGDREDDLTVTQTAFTATYGISLASGANTQLVDLLFPDDWTEAPSTVGEGGPYYLGRVDAVSLSGLPEGVTTFTDWRLVAREQAYIKADWDRSYAGIHASQDGAFTMGNLPDQYQKEDEIGAHGGALLYQTPTRNGDGDLEPVEKTLEELADEWNRIEGWTVTYDAGAADAAVEDAEGNRMVEDARFLLPLVPHLRLTKETDTTPPCAVRAGLVQVINYVAAEDTDPLLVYGRYKIGAALEAQGRTPTGGRAGSGAGVDVARRPTGTIVANGTTDASGYVAISVPVAEISEELELRG